MTHKHTHTHTSETLTRAPSCTQELSVLQKEYLTVRSEMAKNPLAVRIELRKSLSAKNLTPQSTPR